jgi:Flp pilus assembly protein TadD
VLQPDHVYTLNILAHLLSQEPGGHAEAEQRLRRALVLQPDHEHVLSNLSYLLSLREPGGRDVDEAERLRQRSLELQPGYADKLVAAAEPHLASAGGTHG